MLLVGISGKKESGKDTVYQILAKQLAPAVVKREAFADRLKLSALRCFKPDATLEEALEWADVLKADGDVAAYTKSHDMNFPDHIVTGRKFLQNYGTEAHRDVFEYDFWVNQVLPRMAENLLPERYGNADVLVITDARFVNEAQRIRDLGGKIIEVQRPELDAQANDSHASEQPLPRELVDGIIVNSGTLEDLERFVAKIWESLWLK